MYPERPSGEGHLPSALDECYDSMTKIAEWVPAIQPWVGRWLRLLLTAKNEHDALKIEVAHLRSRVAELRGRRALYLE